MAFGIKKGICSHPLLPQRLPPAKGWGWIFPAARLAVRMGRKWAKWCLVADSDTISPYLNAEPPHDALSIVNIPQAVSKCRTCPRMNFTVSHHTLAWTSGLTEPPYCVTF